MTYGDSGPAGTANAGGPLDVVVYIRPGKALGPYTASGLIVSGSGRVTGFTFRATTATIAVAQLYDGGGTNGQAIVDMDVSQGFAVTGGPGEPGIRIERGLYFNVQSGAPSLVVWWIPDQPYTITT